MESPTPVSRYISQNSKKRVFPGGSSSSGFKDVEVLEISPPINLTSRPKSSKQKEVIRHEIIDVDMEEDCADVMLIDDEASKSAKGKEVLSQTIKDGLVDDFNSNLSYGEDEWIDTYFDDIIYDDYAIMESHFDHMDIPPGVEAPFPWLPSSPRSSTKLSMVSPSTNSSAYHPSEVINLSSGLGSSHSSWPSVGVKISDDLSAPWSNSNGMQEDINHPKEKLPSKWKSTTSSGMPPETSHSRKSWMGFNSTGYPSSQPSHGSLTNKSGKELLRSFGRGKKRYHVSNAYSSQHNHLLPGATYPSLPMPKDTLTAGSYMPMWSDVPMTMLEHSIGLSGYVNGGPLSPWPPYPANNHNGVSSVDTPGPVIAELRNVDEVLQKFGIFKKFDTVEDYSDHYYSRNGSPSKQPPKNWAKRIQDEWRILEKDLPDTIFVRVYESRMDLLRAVIIGAEGTPYHDGLFFFDVFFPSTYPNVPPHVHYHSGGLRINPNLYNCGKVCLSLLNTWGGSHKEKWIAGTSTMLQVLVSIQGLILNAKPYFNEPGYAKLSGSVNGEQNSLDYNERTFMQSLQTMVYSMRRPPKHFEVFVMGHFLNRARDILVSCKAYLEGAQVGCLVKGGVQDVDEGDRSCSQYFRSNLAGFITTLVNTFSDIGAKDCHDFLSLAQKAPPVPANAPYSGLPLNAFYP